MVRIALDASGGESAPDAPVQGARDALTERPGAFEVVLVGPQAAIEAAIERTGGPLTGLSVVDAPHTIGMAERPLQAVRAKKRSSIVVGLDMHRRDDVQAFVSGGNTGAVMAGCTLILGLHPGIERPAIGAVLPTGGHPVLIIDAGANIDTGPRELLGFAQLGAVYARDVLGRPDPAVGLLNIGEEPEKGNATVREAYALLDRAPGFRFVGNVEGGDILAARCDVFVCDGFVGNVVLKFYESVGRLFSELLTVALDPAVREGEPMQDITRFLDYASYGGAPLLGVRGVPIICHGRSSARAFKNAVRVALQSVENHLSQDIGAELAQGAVA